MRVYIVSQLVPGLERGHHAHREGKSVLIAVSGQIEVTVSDGTGERVIHLESLDSGVYVPTGIWVAYRAISEGAVLMGLASSGFDESDYIRDRGEFVAWRLSQSLA